MPALSWPQWQGAGGPSVNLPTLHTIKGLITLATPPVIVRGKGFSCSRTSQGLYRITFNKRVPKIIGGQGTLVLPATTTEARFCRGMLTPVAANGYVEFVITDAAGAVQDPVGLDLLSFSIDVMLTNQPG